jgi:hypothetical protein
MPFGRPTPGWLVAAIAMGIDPEFREVGPVGPGGVEERNKVMDEGRKIGDEDGCFTGSKPQVCICEVRRECLTLEKMGGDVDVRPTLGTQIVVGFANRELTRL